MKWERFFRTICFTSNAPHPCSTPLFCSRRSPKCCSTVQFDRAHRVMYDGLYTFAVRLLNIGMAAGLTVLTARMLGPSGRGTYALPGVEAALVASAFGGLSSATSYFLLNRN